MRNRSKFYANLGYMQNIEVVSLHDKFRFNFSWDEYKGIRNVTEYH